MKKIFGLVVVIVVALAVIVPVAAQSAAVVHARAAVQVDTPPAGAVTLPVDLEGLVKLAVIFLVTQGLKSLSQLLKFDLSGYGAAIAAAISGAVILFFNALLAAVPASAQGSVSAFLVFLVAVLSAFGIHNVYKGLSPKN